MAETHKEIVKVWIAPGCIVCDACETDCPEVFDVQEETCIIKPLALKAEYTKPLTPSIIIAAEGCPVEVIKFETIEVEGPEPWAGKEPATAGAGVHGSGGGAEAKAGGAAKKAFSFPEGPPSPKWAGLLSTSHTTPSGSTGRTPAAPLAAKVPAEAINAALPRNAPPDAMAAAMVGSAFSRPRPNVAERIRLTAIEKAEMTRGEFVLALLVGWGALCIVGATVGAALQSFMVPKLTKEPPTTFRAGKLADYADPGVYEQFKATNGVWIVHLPSPDNRIIALSDICTHLGCIPNWLAADNKFKCPCHGSGYYMNGVNFEGPTPRPLERFKISLDGEYVMVDKSAIFRYELHQWDNAASFLAV